MIRVYPIEWLHKEEVLPMKNIGILFGGNSTEYNVSLESAYGVITHMDHTKYLPVLIGITRQGQWLYFNGDPKRLQTTPGSRMRPAAGPLFRRMPQSKAYGFLKETTSPGLPWTAYFLSFTERTARTAQSRGFWKWPGSR